MNLELLFNIKIKKFNFIYILEYEKKDLSLINFCEKFENQIQYFFYSIEKNEFVDNNGNKVKIANYICNLRPNKNLFNYIEYNIETNEKTLKLLFSELPSDYNIKVEENLLTKINEKEIQEKSHEKVDNFLSICDSDGIQIYPHKDNVLINKKRKIFFDKYYPNSIEKIKIISDDNQNLNYNIKEKKKDFLDKDYMKYLNDIIIKNRNKYEFNDSYNKKLESIYKKIYEVNNIDLSEDNNEYFICSKFIGLKKINIFSNIIKLPFYYLYRNKINKEIKLILKKDENSTYSIYDYNSENKINDIVKEILEISNNKKFHNENILALCVFCKEKKKRKFKENKNEEYEYSESFDSFS